MISGYIAMSIRTLTQEQICRFMSVAIEQAWQAVRTGQGGPFGACIVDASSLEIVAKAHNSVLRDNDPSAHAEINAIRFACKSKGSFWLEDCILFSTCEPCPMCLGTIYWSRISAVYFDCSREDAADAGFDDSFIYEQIGLPFEQRKIKFVGLKNSQKSLDVMKYWKSLESKKVY